MNRLAKLLLTLLTFFVLSACGGGGGSGGNSLPSVTYTGLLTQATISTENAMDFSKFLLGEGVFNIPQTEVTVTAPAALAAANSQLDTLTKFSRPLALSASENRFSGSYPGTVSGSVSYTAVLYEDFTGTINFTYVNFNDGDGYTYDGKVTFQIFDYDPVYEEFLSAELITNGLEIQGGGEHLTLAGTAELASNISEPQLNVESISMNFDGRDENTQKTFRLEDFQSVLSCDTTIFPTKTCTEQIAGRIYLEKEGYIEINLDSPLVYNYFSRFNVDVPDAGGPMNLNGAENTREIIRPLSIVRVGIDIDTDGDGDYEESRSYAWRDLVGLVFTFETLQGDSNFNVANDGLETSDSGYLAAGWTNTGGENQLDGYLVKVNAVGELEWAGSYGGARGQEFQSVVRTQDGGYAMIGTSTSTDIPPVERIYMVKTDGEGIEQWSQTWIGDNGDISSNGFAIHENIDGSLIIAGNMYSWGPFSGHVGLGFEDIYLAKLGTDGDLLWEKRLGGTDDDFAYSLLQTADGGYLLAGTSSSLDYTNLREEIYLVKIDGDGNLLWEKHFGGAGNEVMAWSQYGHDAMEDASDNLIVVGSTSTYSYGNVLYLLKLNSYGELIWDKAFAGEDSMPPLNGIDLTATGNYILAGNESFDVHLVEIDTAGTLLWDKRFNWSNYMVMNVANAVQTTSDSGYVFFGSAWPSEGKDFYIVKTNNIGELW